MSIINWELWQKLKGRTKIDTEYKFKKTNTFMNSLDRQYQELLFTIISHGVEKEDRTGTGTKSIFGYTIRHNMREGFPLLTTKKMYWKGIVTELLWFLQGRTDLRFLLENGCHIWTGDAYRVYDKDFDREHPPFSAPYPKRLTIEEFEKKIMEDDEFNKRYGDLGPIYGSQWRHWGDTELDQIAILIDELKKNPDSRRLMVTAWNPEDLYSMVLPPCHYGFQVYTRELSLEERIQFYYKRDCINGKSMSDKILKEELKSERTLKMLDKLNIPTRAISLMWNQRSVDTFLGLPFNIASYGLLLSIIAKEVNMVPDQLIGNLGDVHIYNNHLSQAREQIIREPYPLPFLNFNTEWWEGSLIQNVHSENFCKCLIEEDIQLGNYQSHPGIKADLNN
jgi:thymidylate synthase